MVNEAVTVNEKKIEKNALEEVEPSIVMDSDVRVKRLFVCRCVLWLIALGATAYWVIWSFDIYYKGIYDPYDYAALLRPVFTRGLIISAVALLISLFLRRISDNLKKENAYNRMKEYSMNPGNKETKKPEIGITQSQKTIQK